jgi:hypothetical protein
MTEKWNPARATVRFEGRHVTLSGRQAELAHVMLRKGAAKATDFPAGCRVASYIHRLRHNHALPVETALAETCRGDARFAAYRFCDGVELVRFAPGEYRESGAA